MHELSLVNSVLNIVKTEQEKKGFSEVLEIGLKIGEFSGVIPECFEEFFPIASKGTAAEGAKLVMENVPAEFECRRCRWRGRMAKGSYTCPECSDESLKMVVGRDFYVENLKVE